MGIHLKNKVPITTHMFAIAYALFVFSLLNRDVSNTNALYWLTVPAKYGALAILSAGILYTAYTQKQMLRIIILFLIDALVLIQSGVLTFVLITLFAFLAIKIENKMIMKIAFYTLSIYLIMVIILCYIGVFQNVITNRYVGTSNRYSLGFYHSNVVPLIYSYIVAYGLLSNQIKKHMYWLFLTLDICIFFLCGSRNAFLITILLIGGKYFSETRCAQNILKNNIYNTILEFSAKFCVPFLSLISIGIPLLLEQYQLFSKIDSILSYRFTYIWEKIKSDGLHFLPQITNDTFFSDGIVIDNGYAFLAIRYGLFMSILLSIAIYFIAKYYKKNTFVLIVIILVAFENLIDNDIIDYSCLPYLIIAEKCIINGLKSKKEKYGRTYNRNNEYVQRIN